MDDLDGKILALLAANARMPVKEISRHVALSSPAVSERIRRLEQQGIIEGYTIRYNSEATKGYINALISMTVVPEKREEFFALLKTLPAVRECFQLTGAHSHMVKVCCRDIEALERLVNKLQKIAATNTQIILSVTEGNAPLI